MTDGRDIKTIGLELGELSIGLSERPNDTTLTIVGETITNVYRVVLDLDVSLDKNYLLVYFYDIDGFNSKRLNKFDFKARRVFEVRGGFDGNIVGEVFTKEGASYRAASDKANRQLGMRQQ